MSRILKRPMFRSGGSSNEGIMHGLVDRKGYAEDTGIDSRVVAPTPTGLISSVLTTVTPPTPDVKLNPVSPIAI